jgi:hypothetical protein
LREHIDAAVAERGNILGHRAAGDARDPAVDAHVAQILFEAEPRSRHPLTLANQSGRLSSTRRNLG